MQHFQDSFIGVGRFALKFFSNMVFGLIQTFRSFLYIFSELLNNDVNLQKKGIFRQTFFRNRENHSLLSMNIYLTFAGLQIKSLF